MDGGMQAALALGVGYVLGRRRKVRRATVLAAAAASGGLGGIGRAALRGGMRLLASTEALSKFAPQRGELAGTLRGDLLAAGKAAAAAAASSQIESLTGSQHERAELVRDPDSAGEAAQGAQRRGRIAACGENGEGPPGDQDFGEDGDFREDFDVLAEPEPAPGRRRVGRTANGGPSRSSWGRSAVTRARR